MSSNIVNPNILKYFTQITICLNKLHLKKIISKPHAQKENIILLFLLVLYFNFFIFFLYAVIFFDNERKLFSR
jgi:hypothetical protein